LQHRIGERSALRKRAKLMAWIAFPVGLLLFFVAMLSAPYIPGTKLLLLYLVDTIALLGLILIVVAMYAIYFYFERY